MLASKALLVDISVASACQVQFPRNLHSDKSAHAGRFIRCQWIQASLVSEGPPSNFTHLQCRHCYMSFLCIQRAPLKNPVHLEIGVPQWAG